MPIGSISNININTGIGEPLTIATAATSPTSPEQATKDLAKQLPKFIDDWSRRTGADVDNLDYKQGIQKLYGSLLLSAVDDPASKPVLKTFLAQAREVGRPFGMTFGLPRADDVDALVKAVSLPPAASVAASKASGDRLDLSGLDVHAFVDKLGKSETIGFADLQQALRERSLTPLEKLVVVALETAFEEAPWTRQELIVNLENKVASDEALRDGVTA